MSPRCSRSRALQNNEMQQTRRGENGASLLISVFDAPRMSMGRRVNSRQEGDRWLLTSLWATALLPWLSSLVFGTFVLRAWTILGRWPRPYDPDPKELGLFLHYMLAFFAPGAALLAPAAVPALWIGAAFLRNEKAHLVAAAGVASVGYGALIVWWIMDPGRLLEWIAD
jgi:hypothetical protein